MDSMSSEHIKKMMEMCDYIEEEHAKFLVQVDEKDEEKEQRFNSKLKELKSLIDEVKSIEPKNGENGRDGNVILSVESEDLLPKNANRGDMCVINNTKDIFIYE